MKRFLDVSVSLIALIFLLPVLALIAAVIKADSGGPILYRGVRVGLNGRDFRILKFRSMIPNAELFGGSATANDDPRLTRVGRVLRRFKLDELPQFINVLSGEMSLVGPRPEVRKYCDMYTPEQLPILGLKPGMTDWASIWNSDEGSVLAGSLDPEADYERVIRPVKIALQLKYLRTQTTFTDLRILFCTIIKLVNARWIPADLIEYGTAGINQIPKGEKEQCQLR
jgi:lipopolysaccharide/colanic/teichoic acid biosynthesis glycosyltransferase